MDSLKSPWECLPENTGDGFVEELKREICEGHPLYGAKLRAIARRVDNDDVLFEITDKKFVTQVHLTWRGSTEPNPIWPLARIFMSLAEWEEENGVILVDLRRPF